MMISLVKRGKRHDEYCPDCSQPESQRTVTTRLRDSLTYLSSCSCQKASQLESLLLRHGLAARQTVNVWTTHGAFAFAKPSRLDAASFHAFVTTTGAG
ncbi:hypothetical protein ONE63_000935 [Megalurothrips usitatus]|uniref:Uncharacterized protein n=1 Tax=Megalurothrips usitatus TaxID=439358 RepID=A0AAV7Y4Z8_9NEOP|nr:hypothetical protein ONE63_000935 [Megalurothrips usitatus]